MQKLVIGYLYADLMNTYGDGGNILALVKRCEWRGIVVSVVNISLGEKIPSNVDLIFFGGGQDREQILVAKDLPKKASFLKDFVEKGGPLLSICGGYQLLGNFYKDPEGNILPGIGLFNVNTYAGGKRMIGDVVVKLRITPTQPTPIKGEGEGGGEDNSSLIGFENHSGKTFLGVGMKPLGKVISGFGNNGEDDFEGCVYKNAIGTYLHGSLLPKNPDLADFLIAKALEFRAGKPAKLVSLNDSLELKTHQSLIQKFSK